MNLNIPDEDVDLVIRALEHDCAYTMARKAEDAQIQGSRRAARWWREESERAGEEEPVAGKATEMIFSGRPTARLDLS